jgi:hypothetical protein
MNTESIQLRTGVLLKVIKHLKETGECIKESFDVLNICEHRIYIFLQFWRKLIKELQTAPTSSKLHAIKINAEMAVKAP